MQKMMATPWFSPTHVSQDEIRMKKNGTYSGRIMASFIVCVSLSTLAESATQSIPVTRSQCTPFGNPPRPRTDLLGVTNTLVCAGGGKHLVDWKDPVGTVRHACIYEPNTTSNQPLPLIFWLQGSGVPAELQLHAPVSDVLSQINTADLTGDASRRGFILIELAGRVTNHFYPAPNNTGTSGWDNWDRQLQPNSAGRWVNGKYYPENLDAAAIDHYIDQAVASGKVDPKRVYMMGWSNGAAMSILYTQNRPNIAAAAVYSAPNPYDALSDHCEQTPVVGAPRNDTEVQVFNPNAQIYHIINNCDIYSICPSGVALKNTLLGTRTASMKFQIINEMQAPVSQCMAACGTNPRGTDYTNPGRDWSQAGVGLYGAALHLRWPSNWTGEFFKFLKEHPLTAQGQ